MSKGYQVEVYDDLEDELYLYYEDSLHGDDLKCRILVNGMVAILKYDDDDNEVVKEVVNIEEFLRRVLSR